MFRTALSLTSSDFHISHQDQCLSLGSCFAQMVGKRLAAFKFDSVTNPLGILFNPSSLHKHMRWALSGDTPSRDRIVELHGRQVHYDFHSDINASTKVLLAEAITSGLTTLNRKLIEANWVILTYGTAVAHELNSDVVANCHKQPSKNFDRNLLDESKMLEEALQSLNTLKAVNPKVRVILTVSPVRHIRDTLPVNGISKALLRTLCHRISSSYDWVDYFPAYEILMDDLRDYRFYADDMIHPNSAAEQYIWEKFSTHYFSAETQALNHEWTALRKNLLHKPFNPESLDHQKFLQDTLAKLEQLAQDLPLTKEIRALKTRIHDA